MLDFLTLLGLALIISLLIQFVIRVLAKSFANSDKKVQAVDVNRRNDFVFRDHLDFLFLLPFSIFLLLLADMWGEIRLQTVHFLSVFTFLVTLFVCYRLANPAAGSMSEKDKYGRET